MEKEGDGRCRGCFFRRCRSRAVNRRLRGSRREGAEHRDASFEFRRLERTDRTTTRTDPDTGTTHTTYNDFGDVTSTTDALNQTLSYDYTLPAGYADALGRKTSQWQGAVTTGTKLASWTYDTLSKGQLTSSSRWVGISEYKTAVIGYNSLYQPAGTITTIPAAEGNLAGTYQFSATYNLDGTLNSQTLPTTGDLVPETLNYSYDSATGHAYNPAVKEFTGTRFQTVRYGGKPIRVEPVSGPRTAGVAGMLSIAGDLLLAYDVGKAVASDNPAEGLRDIACGMGSPVCAGYQGNDAAGNSYFRDNNGEISVVPGA